MITCSTVADLQRMKTIGGRSYTCEVCHKKYAGGRYAIRIIDTKAIKLFCPSCWPEFVATFVWLRAGKP